MKYNLDGKVFQSIKNTDNGEVNSDTLFHYYQDSEVISADYCGGSIIKGHLIGKMLKDGNLEFAYHHINREDKVMIGTCTSSPMVLSDGRLKYRENWQWLTGDKSTGESQILEVDGK